MNPKQIKFDFILEINNQLSFYFIAYAYLCSNMFLLTENNIIAREQSKNQPESDRDIHVEGAKDYGNGKLKDL